MNLNSLLVDKISKILIVDYFRDRVKVGGDDTNRDFYYLCLYEDSYLKDCIEGAFHSQHIWYEKETVSYILFEYYYDPNSVARHPSEGYNFNDSFIKARLWLLAIILPFYKEDEHRSRLAEDRQKNRLFNFSDFQIDFETIKKNHEGQVETIVKANATSLSTGKATPYSLCVFDKTIDLEKIRLFLLHLENNKV